MSRVPLLIRVLALRAWLALSGVWIIGTLALVAWAGIGWNQLISARYFGFVFGPPIGILLAWHIVAWVLSPLFPEQAQPVLPSEDFDFIWRFGIYQRLTLFGALAALVLALWLCFGWPIWAGYQLYREETTENRIWFGIAFLFGPLLWVLLLYIGKRLIWWVLPEARKYDGSQRVSADREA